MVGAQHLKANIIQFLKADSPIFAIGVKVIPIKLKKLQKLILEGIK